MDVSNETAKQLYERLKEKREPYITRAEKAAECTIPSLFPKEGSSGSTEFQTPYQSVGARGLNNLASKLLLALMPPNSPFFKYTLSEKEKEAIEKLNDTVISTGVENKLAQREQTIMRYCEARQIRVTVGELCKQLVVAGNGLLFLPPKEGGIKLYRLTSYVVERDALGNVLTIVALDKRTFASLPDNLKETLSDSGKEYKPGEEVDIYTHVFLDKNRWRSYQELEGQRIPKSDQTYPLNKTPWIPVRMVKVDGESYGRGYIEEYQGDLSSLEALSKAIVQYAAAVSRIIFLCNPSGQTSPKALQKAKTGDFVPGRKEDISAFTLDRYADFQVCKAIADGIEARLSYAFLLNSAVQRNGERVTAEEIRYVARELEDTLGGVYSILSLELQLPLARRVEAQLEASGEIVSLPEGAVNTQITTGLEALGRGKDLDKLQIFLEYLKALPGGDAYLKIGEFLTMLGTSLSIDVKTLIKTVEEVQQEQQQALLQEMAIKSSGQLANGFVKAQEPTQQGGQ
ncbi:hypothetical protein SPFL3102_03577 [Sporomusaceae bacterium FL31]|nr:hypothetical protein SPFL3101_00428 [Sporomusaceae bacterium FL31]GCE35726.1 hypothetical protein SPFL3102_03577 [Sporomusaceae bacterium]